MNKNYRLIFYLMFLVILPFGCRKDNYHNDIHLEKNDKINANGNDKIYGYGVVNVNRLRLRSDSDLYSKTLRYFDKGEVLRILDKKDIRVRIDDVDDYWYYVEVEGVKGYVFGFYVDIYSDYENAIYTSQKYLNYNFYEKTKDDKVDYVDFINNNLFFISNGKIVQIVDLKKNKAKILHTDSKFIVTNYFFSKDDSFIYYIAKLSKNIDYNGEFCVYDLRTDKSTLILKDIFCGNINSEANYFLSAKIKKIKSQEYWILEMVNLSDYSSKEIFKLERGEKSEELDTDIFSKTLKREYGSFSQIDYDDKSGIIYFKPPEENQTYLISMVDNSFKKVDIEKVNLFKLDISKYLQVYTVSNAQSEILYSLVLKDEYLSFEKEIIRSKFYPTSVNVSERLGYAVISMVSTDEIKYGCYAGSIYLLSLVTNSFLAISTDGLSYQPKWRYKIIK